MSTVDTSCKQRLPRMGFQAFSGALQTVVLGFSAWITVVGAAHGQAMVDVYGTARENDAELRSARYALDAARQRAPQAWGALLPQLSYTANRQVQKGTLHFSDEDPAAKDVESRTRGWQLTQGIVRPEQWVAVKQAHASESQAVAQFAGAEQALMVRFAQAYLDAWVASEGVSVSNAQLDAVKAQQVLAKRNFEVGATTITDVFEAQAKFDLSLAQSIGAQNQLNALLAELERMVGAPVLRLHGISEGAVLPGGHLESIEPWLTRSRSFQPEVLAATAGVSIANADYMRQQAAFLPTVDLTLKDGFDRSSGSINSPADVGYRTKTRQAALTLNWNVFSGGQSFFRTRESAYQLAKAQADLESAQRKVVASVRQAHSSLRSGQAQIRALASAVKSSKKALDASRVGYRIGTRINIDVLNAENQYFVAQRDFAKARAETLMQWVRLQAAAGEPTIDTIRQVNGWLTPEAQAVSESHAISGETQPLNTPAVMPVSGQNAR